ncbi:MAG: hypothetical protein AMJ65_18665, partial [Phycisphaerae bacterium SG8_4]
MQMNKSNRTSQSQFEDSSATKLHSFAASLSLKIVVIITLAAISPANRGFCAEIEFFVSPDGNDVNPGTRALPFKSLEAARDAVSRSDRNSQRIVWIRAGVYELDRPLVLTAEDSAGSGKRVLYRAWPGEKVRVVGGREIAGFKPVVDRTILGRLVPEARSRILQVDLKAAGIEDYGTAKGGGLELFFDGRPMTLARWPNEGFVKIDGLAEPDTVNVRGTRGSKTGKFMYTGDRPKRWSEENDLWVHGYWFWDWSDERHKVEAIDTEKRIISVAPPYHRYGYRVGQWFYAMNILAELDRPGEWYLDRKTGILYFWPPAPIEEGHPTVSVSDMLVSLSDVSNLTIQGVTLEACRGTAVVMNNCTDTQIVGCVLRNLGSQAVRIEGGSNNSVTACDIYGT